MNTHSTNPLPRPADSVMAQRGDEAQRYHRWGRWSPHSSIGEACLTCRTPYTLEAINDGCPDCRGIR